MPTPARDNPGLGDDEPLAGQTNRSDVARTIIVLAALWLLIAWSLLARDTERADRPARAAIGSIRLDPNAAAWTELAALPGIGPGLARRIIAYRESYAREHGDPLPFRGPKDLEDVRGIGPKRSAQLAPFLRFPQSDLRPPGEK